MKEPSRRKSPRSDLYVIAAIVGIWVVMELLINPRGNFPLNDDWCYSKAVFNLLQTGRLEFIQIIPMTLVTQVLWGALFCKLFGASLFIVRVSTIVLGVIGLLATYGLLREVNPPPGTAFIGCMVIAFSPIYVALSNTFMTDVPFCALAILTLYAFARTLRTDSLAALAGGTLLSCLAVLTRQLGVALPIAFALMYVLKNGIRPRTAIKALIPVVVTAGTLTGYLRWLTATDRLPAFYVLMQGEPFSHLSEGFGSFAAGGIQVVLVSLVYTGLFLLPMLALVRRKAITLIAAVSSAIILIGSVALTHRWMPLKIQPGDILIDFGVGPTTLRDVFIDKLPHIPTAPQAFWIVVTIAGAVGGGMLVEHLVHTMKSLIRWPPKGYTYENALAGMILIVFVLMIMQSIALFGVAYFDRYFLMLMPLGLVLVLLNSGSSIKPSRLLTSLAVTILALFGMFSVGATHDYFSWNRARWEALDDLTNEKHVPVYQIDGGYEFNGWYNYQDDPRQGWWRVIYDDYTIAFGPLPEYEEIRTYPFRRWLPPGEGTILVLRRVE